MHHLCYVYVIVYKYIVMFQHCVILENIHTLPLLIQPTNRFHLAFGVLFANKRLVCAFRMQQNCEKMAFIIQSGIY